MQYNIWFDICALLLLLILLINFYAKYRLPFEQNRFFLMLLWTNLFMVITDFGMAMWFNNSDILQYRFHSILCSITSSAYYLIRNLTAMIYLLYVRSTLNLKRTLKTELLIVAPYFLDILLILSNPFTKAIFYFDENGGFYRGNQIFILYLVAAYFMIIVVSNIIYYRKTISRLMFISFLSFTAINLVAVFVQALDKYLLIEGFMTSMSLLLVFFTIQKPEDILDGITGFMNQKMFLNICTAWMRQENKFRVFVLNIDDYNLILNTYGADTAYALLDKIATYLKPLSNNMAFHISQEQFCFIESYGESSNHNFEEKLQNRFLKPWIINDYNICINASYCSFEFPKNIHNMQELTIILDTIKSKSNKERTQRINIVQNDLNQYYREQQIISMVKNAVELQHLHVVYQPIYCIEENCFLSCEALLRLTDDVLGDISPDEFIPIAEKNGAIVKMGQFVLDTVSSFYTDYSLEQLGVQYIEVNLSVHDFLQDDLIERVKNCIKKHGLSGSQINFEVTETAMDSLPLDMVQKMEELKQMNITFSLDDFGTGCSNINRLTKLPFHIVKIDKSIVQDAFLEKDTMLVLETTIHMIHHLGKKVLVEGVETQVQAETMIELGCDYIQGFYYSHPLTAEDYITFLNEHKKVGK